jgi:alkanesulfonate monooxygenase
MDVYDVTPESDGGPDAPPETFRARLRSAVVRAEREGVSGVLVPHNLREVDPWMVASYIGSVTERLTPLLAVQPACLPPHTAAALAAAYAALFGRPLHFNLVSGAREGELGAVGDTLTHDQRYARLKDFGRVLRQLLDGETVDGQLHHYAYNQYRLVPRPEVLTQCRIFVAGSSPAGMAAALDVADVVVTHPTPFDDWHRECLLPLQAAGYTGELGIRLGIIARSRSTDAWHTARARFPQSWQGHQETLLKTLSPSAWSRALARRAVSEDTEDAQPEGAPDPYWLGAFHSGLASAPFLVGAYEEVAAELARYVGAGVNHLLLNGSREDEYAHIRRSVELALSQSGACAPVHKPT